MIHTSNVHARGNIACDFQSTRQSINQSIDVIFRNVHNSQSAVIYKRTNYEFPQKSFGAITESITWFMASSSRWASLFITATWSVVRVIVCATLGLRTLTEIKRLIFYLHQNEVMSYISLKTPIFNS